jgi:hypothetical protein
MLHYFQPASCRVSRLVKFFSDVPYTRGQAANGDARAYIVIFFHSIDSHPFVATSTPGGGGCCTTQTGSFPPENNINPHVVWFPPFSSSPQLLFLLVTPPPRPGSQPSFVFNSRHQLYASFTLLQRSLEASFLFETVIHRYFSKQNVRQDPCFSCHCRRSFHLCLGCANPRKAH